MQPATGLVLANQEFLFVEGTSRLHQLRPTLTLSLLLLREVFDLLSHGCIAGILRAGSDRVYLDLY
jgi:hypothetical protein